jgi:LPS-assembly protein
VKVCRLFLMLLCLWLPIAPVAPAWGQSSPEDGKKPVTFFADTISYDNTQQHLVAEGNVQFMQDGRILLADHIEYSKQSGTIEAIGHVSLVEPDGSVVFAKRAELQDDLKSGMIDYFQGRLVDDSRLAAYQAVRMENNVTVLDHAVYSPCPVCKEEPEKSPAWQIKAEKATIDENTDKMYYKNAWIEMYGVPVFYTPYFAHALPGAKRKSGFLVPSYQEDSLFGSTVSIPYYYNLAPNQDATITTTHSSDEGFLLDGEYRHMIAQGKLEMQGSITNPHALDAQGNRLSGKGVRGHIEGTGNFTLEDNWSLQFDALRATDDTYLRRYGYSNENVLTTHAKAERIEGRDYFAIESFAFQDVRASRDPANTPLILPHAVYHSENVNETGMRRILDASALSLQRDEGVSTNHISLKGGVEKPYITQGGHVFELATSLRGDGYYVTDVERNDGTLDDGLAGRMIPQASVRWSYPMVNYSGLQQRYIEPVVLTVWSPYGGNPDKIPNEDSQDVEFADDNLFTADHFTGIDRVEGGPRTSYGLRTGFFDPRYGDVDMLFGQSYRVREERNFSTSTGLRDNFSDYVGHVVYHFDDLLEAHYRFRLDKDSLQLRKNRVYTSLHIEPLTLTANYLSTNEEFVSDETVTSENREVIETTASLQLTEQWRLDSSLNRNLEEGEWIDAGGYLWFFGECTDIQLSARRVFTRDRDIRPANEFFFKLFLKNLSY